MTPRRLHPAAVGAEALAGLRQMLFPLVVVVFVGRGDIAFIVVAGVVGTAATVIGAYVSWEATRWTIGAGEVRLKTGVFSERVVTIAFDRVQAIDEARGPVQRLFGVVELQVQSAGGGKGGEIVLKAVTPAEADELREAVRGGRGAPLDAPETPTAPEVVWRLGPRRLLLAALTSGSLGVLVPVVAGASQVLDDVIGAEDAERLLPDTAGEAAVLAAAVLAAAWVLSFVGTIVGFAGFRAIRDGERIRIERGIVERRASSVPVGRIHAIRIVESPLREPFGLAQVRIESAGYADEPATAQTLVPIVRRRDVPAVLGELLPELAAPLDGLAPPPRRALRRFVLPPFAAGLVAAAVPLAIFEADAILALALPAVGSLVGLARFRAAGWRLDGDHVVFRARTLGRTTGIADPRRLQRVTGAQTILQRRAALGDVEIAVSSGRRLGVEHLDKTTVDELVGRLATAAAARRLHAPSAAG